MIGTPDLNIRLVIATAVLAGFVTLVGSCWLESSGQKDEIRYLHTQLEQSAMREGAFKAAIEAQNAEVSRLQEIAAQKAKATAQAIAGAQKARDDAKAAADKLRSLQLPQDECDALRALIDAAVVSDSVRRQSAR